MEDFIHSKKDGEIIARGEVEEISVDILFTYLLSPGDVYYLPKYGKIKRLLTAGECTSNSILPGLVEKGLKKIHIRYAVNFKNIKLLEDILNKYLVSKSEFDRLKLRQQYFSWYSSCFWRGQKRGSLLELICALNNTFLSLPDEIVESLKTKSLVFFHRSFRVSATLFSFALLLGHTDPKFLKELYNTGLLFDFGLHAESFSYHYMQASNLERKEPGSGLEYLKSQNLGKASIDHFMTHPVRGYESLHSYFDKKFDFPELGRLILIHHEAADGAGFPSGLTEQELMGIECLAILAERMFPFESYDYGPKDGVMIVKNLIDKLRVLPNVANTPVNRLISSISELLKERKEVA